MIRREKIRSNVTIKCACGCGNEFNKYDKQGRIRFYMQGHNKTHPPKEMFLKHVIKRNGCWGWSGPKSSDGYPQYGHRCKVYYAHRLSYELYYGVKLNSKDHVCHKCDNPECTNPEHLFLGNSLLNIHDAINKKRMRGNILLVSDIHSIRTLYKDKIYNQYELAKIFKTTQPYISRIVNMKSRKE